MKIQTFLDPIHGSIDLDLSCPADSLINKLINTPEFQRLRRIRHLGFSYFTFYGAETSRFVHSIGVFHNARQILNKLKSKYPNLIQMHQLAIEIAALLHDIGHGPLSHASEPAFGFHHEYWSEKFILENSEINSLLSSYDKDLPNKVIDILKSNTNEPWISEIVSGQFDCDRSDYLIRDSHQTGTTYGVFQFDRIVKSLDIAEYKGRQHLVINQKSLNAIEHYLFARYSMYLQVYHHKSTLAADAMFNSLIKRVREKAQSINITDNLKDLIINGSNISLSSYKQIDDIELWHNIKMWTANEDTVIQYLSNGLLNRNLFQATPLHQLTQNQIKRIKSQYTEEEISYYCITRECKEFPYTDKAKPILIQKGKEIVELSRISKIAATLINKNKELDLTWFFSPKDKTKI